MSKDITKPPSSAHISAPAAQHSSADFGRGVGTAIEMMDGMTDISPDLRSCNSTGLVCGGGSFGFSRVSNQ